MKAKARRVLEQAIEEGVSYGWRRAYKYTDSPSDESVKSSICENVMSHIDTWFDFHADEVIIDDVKADSDALR